MNDSEITSNSLSLTSDASLVALLVPRLVLMPRLFARLPLDGDDEACAEGVDGGLAQHRFGVGHRVEDDVEELRIEFDSELS